MALAIIHPSRLLLMRPPVEDAAGHSDERYRVSGGTSGHNSRELSPRDGRGGRGRRGGSAWTQDRPSDYSDRAVARDGRGGRGGVSGGSCSSGWRRHDPKRDKREYTPPLSFSSAKRTLPTTAADDDYRCRGETKRRRIEEPRPVPKGHLTQLYIPTGFPTFATRDECAAYLGKLGPNQASNPDFPAMKQLITVLVTWDQVERYLLVPVVQGNAVAAASAMSSSTPSSLPRATLADAEAFNVYCRRAGETGTKRLWNNLARTASLPFYNCSGSHVKLAVCSPMREAKVRRRRAVVPVVSPSVSAVPTPVPPVVSPTERIRNTLRYLFFHEKCGIYVKIHDNQVAMFVPFANGDYRNLWSEFLDLDASSYFHEKRQHYRRPENILADRGQWWANGALICNEANPSVWGDAMLPALLNMLLQVCAKRRVPDCDFFVNKRDHPQLKRNLSDANDHVHPRPDWPLLREKYDAYVPICSFFSGHRFADFMIPTTDDWEVATGRVYPRGGDLYSALMRSKAVPLRTMVWDGGHVRIEQVGTVFQTTVSSAAEPSLMVMYEANTLDETIDKGLDKKDQVRFWEWCDAESHYLVYLAFARQSISPTCLTTLEEWSAPPSLASLSCFRISTLVSASDPSQARRGFISVDIAQKRGRIRLTWADLVDTFESWPKAKATLVTLTSKALASSAPPSTMPTPGGPMTPPMAATGTPMAWRHKRPTCLFRGTATGAGTTVHDNQRLYVASLSEEWATMDEYKHGNALDGFAYLDAAVTGWNFRDKKLCGESTMRFVKPNEQAISLGSFVPITQQSAWKYLLYVPGHSASARFTMLMTTGSVIFKVAANPHWCDAPELWYFSMLVPWKHYIPVSADFSDLLTHIEWAKTHDTECETIAREARSFYDTFLCESGVLDYWQALLYTLAPSTVPPRT